MRVVRAASVGLWGLLVGCATGLTSGVEGTDGGGGHDSGVLDSGSRDTGSTQKDSGGGPQDSGGLKEAGGCPGGCLGAASTCCGTTCVDTTSDSANCGMCGMTCGTESCCSSTCVDTKGTDVNNCGGCGVTCAGTCSGGVCTTMCTEDLGSCPHSVCVAGGALTEDCDIGVNDTTFCVCELYDYSCCSTSWTSTCVLYAQACGEPCTGAGC